VAATTSGASPALLKRTVVAPDGAVASDPTAPNAPPSVADGANVPRVSVVAVRTGVVTTPAPSRTAADHATVAD
jgi:hypothetical protein